ncbi:RNA-directed DNA polymerase, eukaryota, reverse transcriptase zinc-binding domain protein [Tanacetum coccineum]
MDKSESYLAAPEHRECYEGLKKSYDLDKTIFSTYGKVYSLKISQKDKDKDEDPSAGSDRGLKKRKTGKDAAPATEELEFEVADLDMPQDQEDNLGNDDEEPKEKENPEGDDYLFDLTKPLPLVMSRNHQKVPVDYFFNNDLKYLQGGISTMTYTTSLTKTKAAQYDLAGIEDMREQRKTFYAYARGLQSRHDVYSTKRILAVTQVEVMRKQVYGYLKEVVVRRADNDLYRFKEGDFPRLRINNIEDMLLLVVQNWLTNLLGDDVSDMAIALRMFTRNLVIQKRVKDLQLGVESYQKKINVTRPQTTISGIRKRNPYTPYQDPQGFIYVDNNGTNRRWSTLEKKRANIMIKAIDKQLKERRLMRSLEKIQGSEPPPTRITSNVKRNFGSPKPAASYRRKKEVYDVAVGMVFFYGVTSSGKTHTMHVIYDLLEPTGQNLCVREDAQGTYVEGKEEEVVLSPARALSFITAGEGLEKKNAAKRLWAVTKLINQAVGDALSGLLLVEAILQHMGWPVDKWNELYHDLPSRQLKPPQNVVSSSSALANSPAFVRPSRTPTSVRFGSALNIKTLVAAAERRETPIDETVKGPGFIFTLRNRESLGMKVYAFIITLAVCTLSLGPGYIFTLTVIPKWECSSYGRSLAMHARGTGRFCIDVCRCGDPISSFGVRAPEWGRVVLSNSSSGFSTKVGGNMSRIQAWVEIVDRVKSRLSKWKMKSLSIGGRLTLLKSVLGSMPIFHMSIFRVPMVVLRSLESIRSYFFNGHELNSSKASWVKWESVLTSKEKGGIGVPSLYALNRALMMKWFWRFYAHKESLWSRVIRAIYGEDGEVENTPKSGYRSCWRNIVNEVKVLSNQGIKVLDSMRIKVGNGEATKFWDDVWICNKALKFSLPRVYALENAKDVSINTKLNDPGLDNSFRRRFRGGVEQLQFKELSDMMLTVTLFLCSGLMECFVPIKVNILAWKIKIDGLPTRFNIPHRGIEIDSIICPLCDVGVESAGHVFFSCCLVRQIARKVCSWWEVEYTNVNSFIEWSNWLDSLRLRHKVKRMFQGVFFVVWWYVWFFRNKLLFEDKKSSKATIFDDIASSSYYWCKFRCKASFTWDDWLKNLKLISL